MRIGPLGLLAAAGCAGGAVDLAASPAELECAAERDTFESTCADHGDGSLECELASESVRTACFTDGKADGPSDILGRMWIDDGGDCYARGDLDCLRDHFRTLVRGWRYVYRYPQAARAMENFLDCEEPELTVPRDAFEADLGANPNFPEALSVGALLETTRADANAWAGTTAETYATTAIGAPLVVPRSDNVRFALGRTTVETSATLVRDTETSFLTIHYAFRDRYDFHPDRIDAHSQGLTYTDAFPYHAWAAALVEAGMACPFDHVGSWDDTIESP